MIHFPVFYWCSTVPNSDSTCADSQSHSGINVIHLTHQNSFVFAQTHWIYIIHTPLYIPRAFDIMSLGWYKQASPRLLWGFSSTYSQSLFFPFLCVSATQLSGQRKELFRHYLSRLVFSSTKLRMNESNPSVFDPWTENVLLWWGWWKAFFFFFPNAELSLMFFGVESRHLVVNRRNETEINLKVVSDFDLCNILLTKQLSHHQK